MVGLALAAAVGTAAQTYKEAFPGVSFKVPVCMAEVPGRPRHFLVLEKNLGNIVLVREQGGAWVREDFAHVEAHKYGFEMGLLGLAFHPGFLSNRRYFVTYNPGTGPLATVLEERQADASLLKDAGASKVREILRIPQPDANHKGGTLGFGKDGFLYMSTGDGGSQGDPQGNGQNTGVLLGKMLRLDVDRTGGGKAYGIPADNPFVGGGGAPEVWAYGLRNPWKWSFDPATGDQWLGDVGGGSSEEVNLIRKGGNYGWSKSEGFAGVTGGITPPVAALPRSDARCIIGGYVFRGAASSRFLGQFIVGDYETRRAWAVKPDGADAAGKGTVTALADLPAKPSAWGVDATGRLYVLGHDNGKAYRLEGTDWEAGPATGLAGEGRLRERLGKTWTGAPGGWLDGQAFGEGETLEIRSLDGTLAGLVSRGFPALPAGLRRGLYILADRSGDGERPPAESLLLVR